MVAGGEQSGYGILTVREQLWMFSQFYGLRAREGWRRVDELIEAVGMQDQRLQRVQHAVHRPAPEDELRARPAQRPVDPVPRRADARPGRRRGPRDPRPGARLEGGRARPDGPADHPLHGRGRRAVRADRHRRPRPDPRHRHARRAQEARPARVDLPARGRPSRRRRRRARAAARAWCPRRSRRDRRTAEQQRVAVNLVLEEDGRSAASSARSAAWAAHPRPAQVRAHPRGRVRRARRPRLRRRVESRRCRRRRRGRPLRRAVRGRATGEPLPGGEAAPMRVYVFRAHREPAQAADWTRRQVARDQHRPILRSRVPARLGACSASPRGSSSRSCCRS